MRHLCLPLCLALFSVVTWPDEHGRGGILYSDWELRRITSPDIATAPYKVASLAAEPALIERPEKPAGGTPEFEGSGTTGEASEKSAEPAPAPPVPIEDVCVAMATSAVISDLPVGFFARLIWQESKFGQWVVSKAGAQGVAQFMPKTAAWIGLTDPFDPIAALPASARFLRMLMEQFGNLGLAAAAYNGGPTRLQNWLAGKGPLPEETRNYVRIITGHDVEKWVSPREIDVSFHLPAKAPCEGLAGLSHQVSHEKHAVEVEPGIARLIETARAEAAKRAARAALLAKKLAKSKFAKKKGGRTQVAASNKAGKGSKRAQAGRPVKLANN
jgi:hypothetical protein